jgi:hypothetical protein
MSKNANALLGQTYATRPMMVLAIDVLLDRRTWRAAVAAALVVGLCTDSSFLPIVISGYLLIGIQAVAYALSQMASGSTSRRALRAGSSPRSPRWSSPRWASRRSCCFRSGPL